MQVNHNEEQEPPSLSPAEGMALFMTTFRSVDDTGDYWQIHQLMKQLWLNTQCGYLKRLLKKREKKVGWVCVCVGGGGGGGAAKILHFLRINDFACSSLVTMRLKRPTGWNTVPFNWKKKITIFSLSTDQLVLTGNTFQICLRGWGGGQGALQHGVTLKKCCTLSKSEGT